VDAACRMLIRKGNGAFSIRRSCGTARGRLRVMSVQFAPCPRCSRHVKRGDGICPFCSATASLEIGPPRTVAGRLSRAALYALGATVACGGEVSRPDAGPSYAEAGAEAEPDASMVTTGTPPYGGSPIEDVDATSIVPGEAPDAAASTLISAPPYGLPPPPQTEE
jgi:hypothetical protein